MTSVGNRRMLPFRRRADDHLLGGVAAGLARGLGLDPIVVRITFVLLAAAGGVGVVLYAAGLLLLPEEPPHQRSTGDDVIRTVGIAAAAVVLMGLARAAEVSLTRAAVWAMVLMAVGALVLWRTAIPEGGDARPSVREVLERVLSAGRGEGDRTGRARTLARIAVGVLLATSGFVAFVTLSSSAGAIGRGLLAGTVAAVGIGLLVGPWLWRLASDLTAERRERIRSQERADMAAHLHDSVLQTLTLIQRHPERSDEVVRLARRQERELRTWLKDPDGDMGAGTLTQRLRTVADQIEDDHGITVDTVFVGDTRMDEDLRPLLQATGEALRNAARHAGVGEVSMYAEVEADVVEVFVRDRGSGFDTTRLPADRRGIAESIRARMSRAGGSAEVRSEPGHGTEVQLRMPGHGGDGR